jgi:hypothetical protein
MKLSNITKSLLALVATFAANGAYAASFTISVGEPTTTGRYEVKAIVDNTIAVPVYFHSDVEATALQIDLKVPAALADVLTFAAEPTTVSSFVGWNKDRVRDTNASAFNSNLLSDGTMRAIITNSRTKEGGGIKASSEMTTDQLYTFKLQIKDGAVVTDKIYEQLYNFVTYVDIVTGAGDTSADYELTVSGDTISTANITANASQVKTLTSPEYSGKISFGAESYTIAAGKSATVALNYASDYDAHMFQFNVVLPDGLSIVDNSQKFTSRTNGLNFDGFTSLGNNKYLVLFKTEDTNSSVAKGEGEFMSFDVAADATFAGGTITVNRVRGSELKATFTINDDEGATVLVTNGLADAKALADAEVKALTDSLAAAKEAVPGQYANNQGVKDAIAAAEAAVKAVSDAVDAAAANNTLAANYDAVLAGKDGAAEAVAAIATAVAAAEKAAETQIDNEQKIQADEKTLADLLDALAAAKEEAGANGDDEAAEAIAKQIADLQESVKQAAADAQDGSGEAYIPMGDVIEEELAQKIEDYKADAAATASLRAANQTAYDAELASIADVEETYQAALSKIASDYPNADVADAKEAVEDAIAAAKAAAAEALATANDSKEAYSHHFNAGPINVLITDLLNKAAADGVAIISVDAAVEGAIYTIDGVRHANPVQGKINIIRTKDSTKKVFVK